MLQLEDYGDLMHKISLSSVNLHLTLHRNHSGNIYLIDPNRLLPVKLFLLNK